MLFRELVTVSDAVASRSRRTEKIELLAALLRLSGADLETALSFLMGRIRQGRIGVGHAAVREIGDLAPPMGSSLSVADVDACFERVSRTVGKGSAGEKVGRLREVFARATEAERRFLAGLVFGEVRHGALEGVMVEAVAVALDASPASVRRATMLSGNLIEVARALAAGGPAALGQFGIELFRPVQPMLAQPCDDVADAVRQLGTAIMEYKIDGARVQVHRQKDEVRVYSRRLRDVTLAVPEVVDAVGALPVSEVILDGEVVALSARGVPRPFQVTMRRFGRKRDVDRMRRELPLTPVWFDLLFVDGESWIDRPLVARMERLRTLVDGVGPVERATISDAAAARAFLDAAIDAGHEGVMAKAPDSRYAAGARGASWLKIKPAHTLDLVVLAADWGHGRRRGWLSNLHLGARDPNGGGFVMLGKTFKGLTDELLAWQTDALQRLQVRTDRYTVYVKPTLVVEVAFNDVQQSPQYPGGVALRFARVKGYREDKPAAQADTIDTVRGLLRV